MMGYVYAIISSLLISLYIVPRKLSQHPPLVFSLLMSVGFALGSIVIYLLFPSLHTQEYVSWNLLWSALAGVLWATSFVCFVTSIDRIGLARSNQWKNLQGPFGVIFSLTLLSEFTVANPFFALLAAFAVFISALFFNIPTGLEKKLESGGVYLALISALGFGVTAVIQKYVTDTVGIFTQQVAWSVSIVISLAIYLVVTNQISKLLIGRKKDYYLGILAGLVYLGASFFHLFSYKYLSASISFTLIQTNALWTILIGIFVFKEIDFKKHYIRVIVGFLFVLLGIATLSLAKK